MVAGHDMARPLQIQNVGIGHAAVVDVARSHRARTVAARAAGAGDVHAAFGGMLAGAAIVIGGDNRRGPLAEDALGDARQRLARAAGDERDERALMFGIQCSRCGIRRASAARAGDSIAASYPVRGRFRRPRDCARISRRPPAAGARPAIRWRRGRFRRPRRWSRGRIRFARRWVGVAPASCWRVSVKCDGAGGTPALRVAAAELLRSLPRFLGARGSWPILASLALARRRRRDRGWRRRGRARRGLRGGARRIARPCDRDRRGARWRYEPRPARRMFRGTPARRPMRGGGRGWRRAWRGGIREFPLARRRVA